MSERPGEPAPSATSTNNDAGGASRLAQNQPAYPGYATQQQHQQPAYAAMTAASPMNARPPLTTSRGIELPPLPQAFNTTGGSFSPASRPVGFASILNPTQSNDSIHGRRRKASHLDSPQSSVASLPPLLTSARNVPQGISGQESSVAGLYSATSNSSRRILTPRSPSFHRAVSWNQPPPPTSSGIPQQSSFPLSPRSRPYTVEPGVSGVPPLPTPSETTRTSYGSSAPTQVADRPRRVSAGTTRARRAPSMSASPSTSYSSYSQAGHTSPSGQHAISGLSTLTSGYSQNGGARNDHRSMNAPSNTPGQDHPRPLGIPISSAAGRDVYQMMTLETTSGTVQLPVDVQAASKVADEKRRRNAGASARFRQRRKEKEKEASTTISKLEQRLRDATESAEFYKRERDYLAGVVLQVPGGDRHFPRPQSPRHRIRRVSSSLSVGSSVPAGLGSMQDQVSQSPQEGRNVRRRTSTISIPPPPPPPTGPTSVPQMQPSYLQQPYGAPQPHHRSPYQVGPGPHPPTLSRAPLPGSASFTTNLPPQHLRSPGPPQLMHAPPQTGPRNPYASRQMGPGNERRDNR